MKPTDTQASSALTDIEILARSLNRDAKRVLQRAASGGSPESAEGRPTSTELGGGAGGAELTATERAADRWFPRTDDADKESDGKEPAHVVGPPVGHGQDPVRRAGLLFARCVRDALVLLERADACRREALGSPQPKVELCAWCDEPAPEVKRVDGKPYHPGRCREMAHDAQRRRNRAA